MVKNKILAYPHEGLRKVCDPVTDGEDCRVLILAMFEILKDSKGLGLSACQIGVFKRVIVVDMGKGDKFSMFNPVITKVSKAQMLSKEGCLSLPGRFYHVMRPKLVTVEGFDINWKPIRRRAKELLARVLQHELDHLNGILIRDIEYKSEAA